MPLRPEDVIRKSFATSRLRQGYDTKDVDAFLEEVVVELRRLYTHIDELEAEAIRRGQREETGLGGERIHLERQQLELIRRERAELIVELRELQAQVDAGPSAILGGMNQGPGSPNINDQVVALQAEIELLKLRDREFRQRLFESVREQMQLLEEGRG